jgi:hypothetical protein
MVVMISEKWAVYTAGAIPTQHPLYFLRTHLRASFCAGRWCGINGRANRILENKEKYDLEE